MAAAVFVAGSVGSPGAAWAQAKKAPPVYVLTPDSNDADEQAEALASALRSHVRETAGAAALGETPNSLAMFQQALRCASYTDTSCLDKIAAQLKTNHFVWGRILRSGPGKLTVTLHLYVKGHPDRSQQVTYSDNLHDANDESLRAVAANLYDQLTGTSTIGTVHVHASDVPGAVYVDGERRTRLDHGGATVTLPIGHHVVEVRAPSYETARQEFEVHGGEDAIFEPMLLPQGTTTDGAGPPVRRIAGYGTVIFGAVAGVVGGVFAAKYAGDVSDAKADRATYSGPATCSDHLSSAVAACNDRSNGQQDSALAWTFGGIGAAAIVTGLVILATDPGSPGDKTGASAAATRAGTVTARSVFSGVSLTPTFGASSNGVSLSGSF